jgi:hypothetical protein
VLTTKTYAHMDKGGCYLKVIRSGDCGVLLNIVIAVR